MKRLLTLRALAVISVLLVSLMLIFTSRSALRKLTIPQQSATASQVLSFSSSSDPLASAPLDCQTCLRNCESNCARYGDTPTTAENQRCFDTCQVQCSDQCGGGSSGKGKK